MNEKVRQQVANLQSKGYQQVWFNGRDIVRITDTGKVQKFSQLSFNAKDTTPAPKKQLQEEQGEYVWGEIGG